MAAPPVLGDVDWRAFRTEPRRDTLRELHGHRDDEGPCWPQPYLRSFGSAAFRAELGRPARCAATQRWEHGLLRQVATGEVRDALAARWGERRTAGALVGPLGETPAVDPSDEALLHAFCTERGWQRPLVRTWEHVGCKAAHVERLSEDGLAAFDDLGVAVLAARTRHRLAVLEELLRAHHGDATRLRGRLDAMDRALDSAGQGRSWWMERVPDHINDLMPMRNLLRLADRQGMIFRSLREADFGEENSYCPEVPVLAVDPDLYGGGIMNHDVTHYLLPVLVGSSRLGFEVGNNGIEGDGQYYNSLIYAHRYGGPDYEGGGAWAEPRVFETLERAFGAASFAESVIAGRTLTVVLHEDFAGDREAVLAELVASLPDGDREVRDELLGYLIHHVQHDHGFLHRLWPRYQTPLFAAWRACFGADRLVDDPETLCRRANNVLWEVEDVDLRTFDHPLRGRVTESLRWTEYLGFKLVELRHLLDLAADPAPELAPAAQALLDDILALGGRWRALSTQVGAATDEVPPARRDADLLAALGLQADALEAADAALRVRARALALDIRRDQDRRWSDPIIEVDPGFIDGWLELFQDYLEEGYYYQHPLHDPEDKLEEVRSEDGAREVRLLVPRPPLGEALAYPDLEQVDPGSTRPS